MKKHNKYSLNGYSNYIECDTQGKILDNFTISMEVTPYTYEGGESGILSAFAVEKCNGILISVAKRGIVTVKAGIGTMNVEIKSLKRHLDYQKSNLITFVFWGDAGWCDLYVNGMLSNRRQFPRHSQVLIPKGKYYIGKYVDNSSYVKETKHGHFHGTIIFPMWEEKQLPFDAVMMFHKTYEKENPIDIDLYELEEELTDIYRPAYHLMPPKKWMNEPHAPFFYNGNYHIFYQANPHAPVWDNLSWGHLISKDMVMWKDAGIALNPDDDWEGLDCDIDGCWSGSSCLDAKGNPILIYTAGDNRELPNQSVATAVPRDYHDIELREWKRQGVILRQDVSQGFLGEFRDPFVWRSEDNFYMLVGTGDAKNGGGNALVYTSKDMKHFSCHGFLLEYDFEMNQECGHVWELPVLLPLYDETGNHACDILLLCACQIEHEIVETYYFLGKFEEESCRFHKYHDKAMLIDLGNGTFTGASGFVTPDKRSVFFTISQGKRGPAEYEAGWAHNGGMPIELSLRDKKLQVNPVREIKQYVSENIFSTETQTDSESKSDEITLLEHRIWVSSKGEKLQIVLDYGSDAYVIGYDKSTGIFDARIKSSGEVISKYRGAIDQVEIGNEPIELEGFLDHSMIEVYLNSRKSMTLRNYQYQKGYRVQVLSDVDYQMNIAAIR